MVGSTGLEKNISIFIQQNEIRISNINQTFFDEFSFTELKDELDQIPGVWDISRKHLQQEIGRPRYIEAYITSVSEKSSTDGYFILSMEYVWSSFRVFESYRRNVYGLDKDDIRIILNQYESTFIAYEMLPGTYSVEDFPEAIYTMGDQEGTLQTE